jgi:hypothetical protein
MTVDEFNGTSVKGMADRIATLIATLLTAAILGSVTLLWNLHISCGDTRNRLDTVEDKLLRLRDGLACSGVGGEYHVICGQLERIEHQQQRILELVGR